MRPGERRREAMLGRLAPCVGEALAGASWVARTLLGAGSQRRGRGVPMPAIGDAAPGNMGLSRANLVQAEWAVR